MPAFPEDSASEAPVSPTVLQEAMEKEELALVTWTTSQDSRGPPSRLARVSTRTSMRLETETSSSEVAAATLRNGAMTIHNETIADFTFRQPSAREGSASPASASTRSTPFRETAEPADVEGNGQANLSSGSGVGFEPTLTIEKISPRCASSRRPCRVPKLRLVGRERVVARVEATHHPGSNRAVLREVRPELQAGLLRQEEQAIDSRLSHQLAVQIELEDVPVPGCGDLVPLARLPLRDRRADRMRPALHIDEFEPEEVDVLRELKLAVGHVDEGRVVLVPCPPVRLEPERDTPLFPAERLGEVVCLDRRGSRELLAVLDDGARHGIPVGAGHYCWPSPLPLRPQERLAPRLPQPPSLARDVRPRRQRRRPIGREPRTDGRRARCGGLVRA